MIRGEEHISFFFVNVFPRLIDPRFFSINIFLFIFIKEI